MKIYTKIIFNMESGETLYEEHFNYEGPIAQLFTLGGSKSSQKSKSQSTGSAPLTYPRDFLDAFQADFPEWKFANQSGISIDSVHPGEKQYLGVGLPKFYSLSDGDYGKLEKSLFDQQMNFLNPKYEQERARTREELSQSGLLTSPAAYGSGGALDQLSKSFLQSTQQAASNASGRTVELKANELARRTGWDQDIIRLLEEIFQNRSRLAIGAASGQGPSSSKGSGNSFGFNFGMGW